MDPFTLLLIGGGVVSLIALFGNKGGDGGPVKPEDFREAIVLDGTEGSDYDIAISAIEAGVSPYDKDALVIFYNNSQSASDPELRKAINEAAMEAGVKGLVHVYGPSSGAPAARHYSEGALVEELEAGTSPDGVVDWIDAKAAAAAGRQVFAYAGGRKVIAAAGGGGKHMAAMHAASTVGNRGHIHRKPRRTVQARARRRR